MTPQQHLEDIIHRDSTNGPFSRMDTRWLIERVKSLESTLTLFATHTPRSEAGVIEKAINEAYAKESKEALERSDE